MPGLPAQAEILCRQVEASVPRAVETVTDIRRSLRAATAGFILPGCLASMIPVVAGPQR